MITMWKSLKKNLEDDELTVQLPVKSKETSVQIQTRKSSKHVDQRNHSFRSTFIFFKSLNARQMLPNRDT